MQRAWSNPLEYCSEFEYDGQIAGAFNNDSPISNSSGALTSKAAASGVVELSKLLAFATSESSTIISVIVRHLNREARYLNINFCEQLDAICASEDKELKWIAGMF